MKVGILTFPNSVSYGACLQMIALQNTVRRMGHEVEIIRYHNPYMKAEKHTDKGRDSYYVGGQYPASAKRGRLL